MNRRTGLLTRTTLVSAGLAVLGIATAMVHFGPRFEPPPIHVALGTPASPTRASDTPASRSPAVTLPSPFERNVGQSDARVQFIARGPGYSMLFAPGEATLRLQRRQPVPRAMNCTRASDCPTLRSNGEGSVTAGLRDAGVPDARVGEAGVPSTDRKSVV